MGDDTEDHSVDAKDLNDPTKFEPERFVGKEQPESSSTDKEQDEEKIADHSVEQAEKLLKEPILIPRSPASLAVQLVALVFLLDFTAIMIFLLVALLFQSSAGAMFIAGGIILFAKSAILIGLIVQTTYKWLSVSYYMNERQLIMQEGFVNKVDKTFELSNIRNVSVKQDYVAKKFDFGRIEMVCATAGLNEDIELKDVKNPKHFEKVFRNYLG